MNGATLEQARAAKLDAAKLFERSGQLASIGLTRVGVGWGVALHFRKLPKDVVIPECVGNVPLVVDVVGQVMFRSL